MSQHIDPPASQADLDALNSNLMSNQIYSGSVTAVGGSYGIIYLPISWEQYDLVNAYANNDNGFSFNREMDGQKRWYVAKEAWYNVQKTVRYFYKKI